jgi:hypothetical protein
LREGLPVRPLLWTLTILALMYSAARFAQSGVLFPLSEPNLGKFEEETPPLRAHLATGEPVHIDNHNPAPYGPVFFLVTQPLLQWTHSDRAFASALYAVQIICLGLGFWLTCATLRPLARPRDWPLVVAWLLVLWLTFTPLLTIIALKSVETWELMLLSLALYAYARGKLWVMAFAIAAAALVKVLPLIFFFYLLVTNRRAFAYASVALLVLLLISHAMYGPEMGLRYLPSVARAATGHSYGLTWHENLSLKAAVAKMIGHLRTPDAGQDTFRLVLTDPESRVVGVIGDTLAVFGLGLLAWTWRQGGTRSPGAILWEWSLVAPAMLILSPNATFEYATLVLGAISYALVRLVSSPVPIESRARTWWCLSGAMFLLGAVLPRQVLNRVTFVDVINRWTGYYHLSPSEAYQYYCFPLVGLILLVAALWRLRPLTSVPLSGPVRAESPFSPQS